ncbi:MAG: hypothetical protein ABWY52_08570 [Candidatus Limnocylindrales bacterium]
MKRIAAALLVLVLAACTASDSPSPSESVMPSASSSSTPPTQATPTAASTPASTTAAPPEPTADLGEFICRYPYAVDGNVSRAQIDAVRVGTHSGYDRIVFGFEDGIPALDVNVGAPPLTYDPSGLPMEVAGNDFLIFILRGGTGVGPSGRVTYDGPTDFTPDHPVLVQFVQAGDFEAQSEWVAGLTGPACIRVFALSDPDRLVIDLAAQ